MTKEEQIVSNLRWETYVDIHKGTNITKEEHIISGFNKLYNKLNSLNSMDEKKELEGFHSSDVHCLELIKKLQDANVTKLAEASFMTRGGISKMVKKLLKYNTIVGYKKPANKKEIYFKLTELGEEICSQHEGFHKKWIQRDMAVFNELREEEKDIILEFIEKYNSHLEAEINNMRSLKDSL